MSKEKTLKENRVFKGRILEFYNDEVLCANDVVSTREYIKHPGGVCILGFIDNKIPLVKQYRYALQKELLELPAGKLEKGENPEAGAIREYEEEVGYPLHKIITGGSAIYFKMLFPSEYIFDENLVLDGEYLVLERLINK